MVRELTDVEVLAPDDATFECELSAPVVKAPVWTLKGELLQASSRVRLEKMGTVHRLTLRQTSTDMSGEVEFICGKTRSRAGLQVKEEVALFLSSVCISNLISFEKNSKTNLNF